MAKLARKGIVVVGLVAVESGTVQRVKQTYKECFTGLWEQVGKSRTVLM